MKLNDRNKRYNTIVNVISVNIPEEGPDFYNI